MKAPYAVMKAPFILTHAVMKAPFILTHAVMKGEAGCKLNEKVLHTRFYTTEQEKKSVFEEIKEIQNLSRTNKAIEKNLFKIFLISPEYFKHVFKEKGISKASLDKVRAKLKEGTFKFSNSLTMKAPFILTSSGIQGKLDDYIVQEIVRNVLHVIYTPLYSRCSYAHTNRSMGEFLWAMGRGLRFCPFFVKGSIASIDNYLLIWSLRGFLKEKIKDKRFLDLISQYLEVSPMIDVIMHSKILPTANLNSMLTNIYFTAFDHLVERHLPSVVYIRYLNNWLITSTHPLSSSLSKNLDWIYNRCQFKYGLTYNKAPILDLRDASLEFLNMSISLNKIRPYVRFLAPSSIIQKEFKAQRKFIHLELIKLPLYERVLKANDILRELGMTYPSVYNKGDLIHRVHFIIHTILLETMAESLELKGKAAVTAIYGQEVYVKKGLKATRFVEQKEINQRVGAVYFKAFRFNL